MLKTRMIDGVWINPELPEEFDCTPNDERGADELDMWWEVPYIVVDDFSVPDAEYPAFVKRMTGCGQPVESEAEYNARVEKNQRGWFEEFPSGYRFNVRRLDGGAWDRSTSYGFFGSLDDALRQVKSLLARVEAA